ncbi:MAG: bacterial transcriptional activator domain-containing protein [Gammaproteobacteria bacterium]|nr:bacterial transcriptional activator domain-containing protein [Gammaproteobacteria bacterium]
MRWTNKLLLFAALNVTLMAPTLAVDENAARLEFNSIMQGLNENSFDRFHRATDDRELKSRIFGQRLIDPAVRQSVVNDFDATIEGMFASSFPESRKEILATVVDFQLPGTEGRAVVRYEASGYRYSYHVYELRLDAKGRVRIVDWIDYYQGNRFSSEAGTALVVAMPSKAATRNLLKGSNPDEGQVFQVSELLKAVRDKNLQRFFQIYDGLDERLQKNAFIVRLNLQFSMRARDKARIAAAEERLSEVFPGDALHGLQLIDYYLPTRQYQQAIDALERLQQELGVVDGATESLKAMAALAQGDLERAGQFALRATEAEPALELSWWSLLRVRTRAGDFGGATEVLARLEDDFGQQLGPGKLKKDPFLQVLAERQEYLDWRASRQ